MIRKVAAITITSMCLGTASWAADFEITGTPLSSDLLKQNYGTLPKGVSGFDLSICNTTDTKQSIVSSKIYQAIAQTDSTLQPIGRDIMLTAILHNQNHSLSAIASTLLSTSGGMMTVLNVSGHAPGGLQTGIALLSFAGQELLRDLKPILTADQLQKFESQVLEPALVLDGGSCVERTVFVTSSSIKPAKAKGTGLSFHIH